MADFEEDPELPADWHHIDYVLVLFQTGNVLGGHDFAVTKITAVPPPPPVPSTSPHVDSLILD